MTENFILYLIGFAGVGKLTIAKEIVSKTKFILIHNHLINNPILSVVALDGKSPLPAKVKKKISIIRQTVLETIIELSPPHFSFIFTNELIEGMQADKTIFEQIEEVAKIRKSRFLPVRIICNEDVLCKRVVSEDRKDNLKLTDKSATIKKFRNKEVFNPPVESFTIDVTELSAEQAAKAILKEFVKAK